MILLRLVYDGERPVFDHVGTTLLPLFPFTTMFLVTSVAMLRERSSGTLERLLTMPMHKLDLLLGYGVAFSATAVVQVLLACAVALGPLGLSLKGSPAMVVLLAALVALLGMALWPFRQRLRPHRVPGRAVPPRLRVSAASSVWPAGAARPDAVDAEPGLRHRPLSYAVDGINRVGSSAEVSSDLVRDLVVIGAVAVVALLLASATLRRRSA